MTQDTKHTSRLYDLQADQHVYGSDGERIGQVEGFTVDMESGENYLEVAAGPFTPLYVPEHAIAYAEMGQPVRLNVPADEAKERFIIKPNAL